MEKYIKAGALIADLLSYAEANKGTYHEEGFKNAITVVEDQPPADVVPKEQYANLLANSIIVCEALKKYRSSDVVEVVRCKDCVHKEREQPGMVFCPMMVGSWVDEDHFCGWGERRDDDEKGFTKSD